MSNGIIKHSISIAGHQTSISLEDEFWSAFKDICEQLERTPADVIKEIDETRSSNLSSAIRLYVLKWYRTNHS